MGIRSYFKANISYFHLFISLKWPYFNKKKTLKKYIDFVEKFTY